MKLQIFPTPFRRPRTRMGGLARPQTPGPREMHPKSQKNPTPFRRRTHDQRTSTGLGRWIPSPSRQGSLAGPPPIHGKVIKLKIIYLHCVLTEQYRVLEWDTHRFRVQSWGTELFFRVPKWGTSTILGYQNGVQSRFWGTEMGYRHNFGVPKWGTGTILRY